MLKKNIKNKTCPFTDDIVSYIYGEIGGAAENDFEMHLAECTICTDEFATVSNSRFSVFEWKKEVFDPLPTPRISIPFETSEVSENVGWIAAVRAWVESLKVPAAVIAGLAVCAGIALILLGYAGKTEPQAVANSSVPPIVESQSDIAANEPAGRPETSEPTFTGKPVRPFAASIPRPKHRIKPRPATSDRPVDNFAISPNRIQTLPNAPALTQYQESDDNSLRLADLFDEVGG